MIFVTLKKIKPKGCKSFNKPYAFVDLDPPYVEQYATSMHN